MVARPVLAALLLCSVSPSLRAEDWTSFRGPAGNGQLLAHVPDGWSSEQHLAWAVEIPGTGWSQPVTLGGKIYLTTAITENQQKPKPFQFGGGPGGGFGPGFGPGGPAGPPPREGQPGPRGDRPARPEGAPPRDGERPQGDAPRRPGGRGPGGGFPGGFGRTPEPPDAVYQWKVLCLDGRTGQVLWEQLAKEGKPTIATQSANTYASETPVVDGQRLYAYFGMTGVFCFDLSGKPLWSQDLGSYPMMMGWGTGSSPVLHGDHLFIQCDNDKSSFLVALNKLTGEEAWRVPRDERTGWSTPYVWKNKARTELVTAGINKVRSYDPDNGELLWELGGMRGQSAATPVGDEELLYVGTSGGMAGAGPLAAVKAGATGDISPADGESTSPGLAWLVERAGPSMASPLLYRGCLYVLDQRGGTLSCYDAQTGERHFRERLPDAKGFTSSPWAAGGKVYCLDEDGRTFVLEPGTSLNVLATNKLDDMFWSSVSVVGENLLLRGVNKLYCIAK